MAVVGSFEDGLTGNYQIWLVKSLLDGIFSMLLPPVWESGCCFQPYLYSSIRSYQFGEQDFQTLLSI